MFRLFVAAVFFVVAGSVLGETPDRKAYGRREINAQLQLIRIGSLRCESAPLDEVLKSLAAEAEKDSYPRRSLNLIARDMGDVRVTVHPPLENVPLKDALDAVAQGANQPITCNVTPYGIVFSRGELPRTIDMLRLRVFQLRRPMGNWNVTTEELREFLAAHGIDCAPPVQVFLNARLGKLLVRATIEDLEKIEAILRELIASARRIRFELRFAEVPAAPAPILLPDLSLDTGLPLPRFKTPQSELNGIFRGQYTLDGEFVSQRMPLTNYALASGTLNENEFTSVLGVLQQKAGVDLLTFPHGNARDNERAHFKLGSGAPPGEGGPSAAVHPVIAEDGKSIRAAITAAVRELVGYDWQRPWDTSSGPPTGNIRLRQINDNFDLPLGYTAVLGIGPVTYTQMSTRSTIPMLADLPLAGRLFRRDVKTNVEKNLWFFLTPRLED